MIRTSTYTGMQRYLDIMSQARTEGKVPSDTRGAYNYGGRSDVARSKKLSKLQAELNKLRKENEKLQAKASAKTVPTQEDILRAKAREQWAKNYSKPTQFGNVDHIRSVGNGL